MSGRSRVSHQEALLSNVEILFESAWHTSSARACTYDTHAYLFLRSQKGFHETSLEISIIWNATVPTSAKPRENQILWVHHMFSHVIYQSKTFFTLWILEWIIWHFNPIATWTFGKIFSPMSGRLKPMRWWHYQYVVQPFAPWSTEMLWWFVGKGFGTLASFHSIQMTHRCDWPTHLEMIDQESTVECLRFHLYQIHFEKNLVIVLYKVNMLASEQVCRTDSNVTFKSAPRILWCSNDSKRTADIYENNLSLFWMEKYTTHFPVGPFFSPKVIKACCGTIQTPATCAKSRIKSPHNLIRATTTKRIVIARAIDHLCIQCGEILKFKRRLGSGH